MFERERERRRERDRVRWRETESVCVRERASRRDRLCVREWEREEERERVRERVRERGVGGCLAVEAPGCDAASVFWPRAKVHLPSIE